MIHPLKGYCTVCKDDKTPCSSIPNCSRPNKRRAPLAEVNGNMGVVEGPPIKKRQRPTQSK